jgi:metal-responsive CopG/Arc/MetJ family transcriptional regulator
MYNGFMAYTRISVSMTHEELEEIDAARRLAKVTRSRYLVEAALAAARSERELAEKLAKVKADHAAASKNTLTAIAVRVLSENLAG